MMATLVKCFLKPLEWHLTVNRFQWICINCENKGAKGVDLQTNLRGSLLASPGVPFTWNSERQVEGLRAVF